MANIKDNRINVNMTLSQSYSQGVERIRKQMNNIGPLELPKEILIQREHAWDKLFEKYLDNVSNDIELNIRDSDSESKKNELKNGDNDYEQNDDEYFSKCRTPMRKHPALVQYWVDTGNPPYQLIDGNSSETGSSLSEAENSKSTPILANECSNVVNKQSNGTSLYSSVDTIAYILSNANVTKKSDATAIMNGVKHTNGSPGHSANVKTRSILSKNSPTDCATMSKTLRSVKNEDPDEKCDPPILGPIMHKTMKITDILPTLAQFDEMMMPKHIQENKEDSIISDDASLFEGTPKTFKQPRPFNRKKLYTARNSPIDVIVTALENKKRLSKSIFHPALCTPKIKRNTLLSRRRTSLFQKRRRKRLSRLADALQNSEKSINDEDNNERNQQNCDKNPLESLKVTQSDSKMCRRTGRIPTIAQVSPKMDVNRGCTSVYTGYYVDVSKNTTKPCTNDSTTPQTEEKMKNLIELCSRKNLQIRLERYEEKNPSPKDTPQKCMNNKQLTNVLPSSDNELSHEVHQLEFESQGSDQSTILIYKCANDQENNSNSMKSLNQSNGETVGETKELNKNNKRKRKKSNKRKTSKNVQATKEMPTQTHNINRSSVTMHSKLIFASDHESPTRISSKFFHGSETHPSNLLIKFSSDEEDDFLDIIQKNSREHTGKQNIIIPTSDKFHANSENNSENSIENLSGQFTETRQIPTATTTMMDFTIIDSDDEEITNAQKCITNTKRTSNQRVESSNKSSVKPRSMLYASDDMNTHGNFIKNSTTKVLRDNSPQCIVTTDTENDHPTKKLKLTRKKEIRRTRNTTIRKSRKILKESADKNSNLCDTVLTVNTNVPTENGDQIETRVPSTNQTIEISSNERRKLRTKNPTKLNRNTIENENVSELSDSPKSENFILKSNGTSTDKSELLHCSENTVELSSSKNIDDNIHTSFPWKNLPNLFDDISSDGSLQFLPRGPDRHVKMKKPLKNKIVTFRTKSDDSESDESI